MAEQALGAIETFGLVPAIEAADVALKSADIDLGGMEKTGAGLVTVLLRGDVSSVKAALDAGAQAAARIGEVLSTTVIARTAEGLELMLSGPSGKDETESSQPEGLGTDSRQEEAVAAVSQLAEEAEVAGMSVVELRAFVRTLAGYPMDRQAIRSARRQDLLAALASYLSERKK